MTLGINIVIHVSNGSLVRWPNVFHSQDLNLKDTVESCRLVHLLIWACLLATCMSYADIALDRVTQKHEDASPSLQHFMLTWPKESCSRTQITHLNS